MDESSNKDKEVAEYFIIIKLFNTLIKFISKRMAFGIHLQI